MVKLGSKVTDSITGYSGVALCRIEYMNGCIRYEVQSPTLFEGKVVQSEFFDEQRLTETPEAKAGGPPTTRNPPRSTVF